MMGTLGYMAPEQLRGEPCGPASDIFALGAVLYEMLAGRRAFEGGSAQETLSAILRDDPEELRRSNTSIPAELTRIVVHCLEKDPAERSSRHATSPLRSERSPAVDRRAASTRKRRFVPPPCFRTV